MGGKNVEDFGHRWVYLIVFLFVSTILFGQLACQSTSAKYANGLPLVSRPESAIDVSAIQLTTGLSSKFMSDLSANGRYLYFVDSENGNQDLWRKDLEEETYKRLTHHPAEDFSPQISPSGELLAFTSRRYDAFGDIVIMNSDGTGPRAIITNSDTQDSCPTWFPDNVHVIFEAHDPGQNQSWLTLVDIEEKKKRRIQVPGARMPHVSKNGRWVAFVRRQQLYVLDIKTLFYYQLTDGTNGLDFFPQFSSDNQTIYFYRYREDTNGDGHVNLYDNAAIFEIALPRVLTQSPGDLKPAFNLFFYGDGGQVTAQKLAKLPVAMPVTSFASSASYPHASEQGIFFSLQYKEQVQIAKIANNRVKLSLKTPSELLLLAQRQENAWDQIFYLDQQVDPSLLRQKLAIYYDRQEYYPAYQVAKQLAAAPDNYHETLGLAHILKVKAHQIWPRKSNYIPPETVKKLQQIMKAITSLFNENSAADAEIMLILGQVQWLANQDFIALKTLTQVREKYPDQQQVIARAQLFIGRVYELLQNIDHILSAYTKLLNDHSDLVELALNAANRSILVIEKSMTSLSDSEKIIQLRRLFAIYRQVPFLKSRLHFMIAGLYLRLNRLSVAKNEYLTILKTYNDDPGILVKAARALIKLTEAEKNWKQAEEILLDLQKQVRLFPVYKTLAEQLVLDFQFARAALDLNQGEVILAYKRYRKLERQFPRNIKVHRGIITTGFLLKKLPQLLTAYRTTFFNTPDDAQNLYLLAFAITYQIDLETEGEKKLLYIAEATRLIRRAIHLNPRTYFYHLTLGWLYELREKVFHQKGQWLEKATESYLLALNLAKSPSQRGNILLNLGNVYQQMNSFQKAKTYYERRFLANIPFSSVNREVQFYNSYARALFHQQRFEAAIKIQTRAVELWKSLDDRNQVYRSMDTLALYHREAGSTGEAIKIYEILLERNQQQGHFENEVKLLQNIGAAYYEAQAFHPATQYFFQSYQKIEQNRNPLENEISNDILISLDGAGTASALGFDMTTRLRLSLSYLINMLLKKQAYEVAITLLIQKEQIVLRLIKKGETTHLYQELAIIYNNLAFSFTAIARHQQALGYINRTLAILQHGRFNGKDLLIRGDILLNIIERNKIILSHRQINSHPLADLALSPLLSELQTRIQSIEGLAPAEKQLFMAFLFQLYRQKGSLRIIEIKDQTGQKKNLAIDGAITQLREWHNGYVMAAQEYRQALKIAVNIGLKGPQVTSVYTDLKTLERFLGPKPAGSGSPDGNLNAGSVDVGETENDWRFQLFTGNCDQAWRLYMKEKKPGPTKVSEPHPEDLPEIALTFKNLKKCVLQSAWGQVNDKQTAYTQILNQILTLESVDPVLMHAQMNQWIPPQVKTIQADLAENERILVPFSFFQPSLYLEISSGQIRALTAEATWPKTVHLFLPLGIDDRMDDLIHLFRLKEVSWSYTPALGVISRMKKLVRIGKQTVALIGDNAKQKTQQEAYLSNFEASFHHQIEPELLVDVALNVNILHIEKPLNMIPSIPQHNKIDGFEGLLGFQSWQPARNKKITNNNLMLFTQVNRPSNQPGFFDDLRLLSLNLMNMGCPTVLLVDKQLPAESQVSFLKAFYHNIQTFSFSQSVFDARKNLVMPDQKKREKLIVLLGMQGMTNTEETKFAEVNIDNLMEDAQKHYEAGNYQAALEQFKKVFLFLGRLDELEESGAEVLQYIINAALLQKKYPVAYHYQTILMDLVQETVLDKARAIQIYDLGMYALRANKYEAAAIQFPAAIKLFEALKDQLGIARSFMRLAELDQKRGRFPAAIDHYERAARLFSQLGKKSDAFNMKNNIGTIYNDRLGDYFKAIEQYETLVRDMSGSELPDLFSNVQISLSIAYEKIGQFSTALGLIESSLAFINQQLEKEHTPALRASQRQGLEFNRIRAQLNFAKLLWFTADYQKALQIQRQVIVILDEQIRVQKQTHSKDQKNVQSLSKEFNLKISGLNLEGLIYSFLNNFELAERAFQTALTLAEKEEITVRIPELFNNLGYMYRRQGKIQTSQDYFNRAVVLDKASKDEIGLSYDYRNLGVSYVLLHDYAKAETLLNLALKSSVHAKIRDNEIKTYLALGDLWLQQADLGKALSFYGQAQTLAEKLNLKESLWKAMAAMATVHFKLGKRQMAIDGMRQVIEILESLRSKLKSKALRTSFVSDKGVQEVYRDIVLWLMEVGNIDLAFEYNERARARSFIDSLGSAKRFVKNKTSKIMLEQEQTLKDSWLKLEDQLFRTQDPGKRQVLANRVKIIKQEYELLLERLSAENPELSSLVSTKPITVEEVQRYLDSDTAIVEFMVAEEKLAVWVIRKNKTQGMLIPISKEQLTTNIKQFRSVMQSLSSVDIESQGIFASIMLPIKPYLGGIKTIGLVPHAILHYLSFAALLDASENKFLLESYSLFYLPSSSVLRFLKTPPRTFNQVLAFGNPDLKRQALQLPFAVKEISSISRFMEKPKLFLGKQATESNFRANLGVNDVLHIATHGQYDQFSPSFSKLFLAKDNSHDGNLNVFEIYGLSIKAPLIILSACQSGLGFVNQGDEMVGLSRAFLFSGAKSVIASLWRISDVATAITVKRFYRYLNHSPTVAVALQRAQLLVKHYYPHPAYWAALTLTGQYKY